jgi:replicative DNA helicase
MNNFIPKSLNSDSENLSNYGKLFQNKLLYLIMTDKNFLEQIIESLNFDIFENESANWIVNIIKSHYLEFKELPDIENFKVYITNDNVLTKTSKFAIAENLKSVIESKTTNNFDFVKKETISYLKQQSIQNVLIESIDLLKNKKFEKIKTLIDGAMLVGEDKRVGHELNEIDIRYNENNRKPILTGWKPVDDATDGGLGAGEMGVVLAPSSIGKSWALIHMAVNVSKKGYKVVYYTFEDEEIFHAKRVDSILTGISTKDLKYHVNEIKTSHNIIKGNILFKHYPQEITTILSIEAHLNRLKLLHRFPDLIIIDYGDIMAPITKRQSDWLNQRQIFNEIKSLAQTQHIPIWTAAQASKGAKDKDIVDDTDMAQAYAKVAPSNIILTLSRKIDDKLGNTGRMFIAKNKYGEDSITFPLKINHSKGIFDVMSSNTQEGKELTKKMSDGDALVKQRLKERFNQFKQLNDEE